MSCGGAGKRGGTGTGVGARRCPGGLGGGSCWAAVQALAAVRLLRDLKYMYKRGGEAAEVPVVNPQRSGARPLGTDFFIRLISVSPIAKNMCPGFLSGRVLPGFQTGLWWFVVCWVFWGFFLVFFFLPLYVVWTLLGAFYYYFGIRGQSCNGKAMGGEVQYLKGMPAARM